MNKVVARFADGRLLKGFTNDFNPEKEQFHVTPRGAGVDGVPVAIRTEELKALFFVKDFKGNPEHVERQDFDPALPTALRKVRVHFNDGEVLIGTTMGYRHGRPGFFLESVDAESNIERCYVFLRATRNVTFE